MLASKYELDTTTHYWVITIFNWIRYVTLWPWQKLSCVKLAICPDHPRRRRPLKFCMRGRVREVVIYFKFHENRSRVSELWRVENRPLPLTWPMAYTTAYITVQAVIVRIWGVKWELLSRVIPRSLKV